MDYASSFAISAAGMNIERTRVDVAALNLANANTVQGVNGLRYQPLRVVAQAAAGADAPLGGPASGQDFAAWMAREADALGDALPAALPTVTIVPTGASARQVYEPGHPLADDKGYVAYAAVDPAAEMIGLMSATRAYEANVAAMNTARTLALKALEIGGATT